MQNILIMAQFEMRRLFVSARGWLALLTFALVWAVLLRYVILNAAGFVADENSARLIGGLTGNRGVQNLLAWPVAEISVFWGLALYLFPLFCIVISADQIASDRQRGGLRFICLRSSRDAVFFARFIGQMGNQLLLVLLTVGSVVVLAVLRDASLLVPAIDLGFLVSVNLLAVLLPFTAMMAAVSVFASSAKQAVMLGVIFWLLLFFSSVIFPIYFPWLDFMQWLLPGAQRSLLLEKTGWDTLKLAPLAIVQALVLLALGAWLLRRGDI